MHKSGCEYNELENMSLWQKLSSLMCGNKLGSRIIVHKPQNLGKKFPNLFFHYLFSSFYNNRIDIEFVDGLLST